jgi:hypothetical protein
MKFSIGDKIILKRTGEEGIVTAYISDDMLEVEVEGTAFPVHMDEVDHPYLKWFTEKKAQKPKSVPDQLPVEKKQDQLPRLAKGVYLSFIPVFKTQELEDIVDYLKIYLLNELPQTISFKYDVRFLNESEFRHEGNLHGFGHIYLHSIVYDDMNDQPRFHWQLTDPAQKAMDIAEGILRIRPVKLFEHVNDLLKNNEASFSYLLIDDFKPKQKPQKPEKFELPVARSLVSTRFSKITELPKYEIDLHIEKLTGNRRGLSNADMLQIQLSALQKALDNAILYRQEMFVVIHGLGKGKLKEEVHKLLAQTPYVERYTNEFHPRYGYGATEVFFKY